MKLIDMDYWLQQWRLSPKESEALPLLMRRIGHAYSLRHRSKHRQFFKQRCRGDIRALRNLLGVYREQSSIR